MSHDIFACTAPLEPLSPWSLSASTSFTALPPFPPTSAQRRCHPEEALYLQSWGIVLAANAGPRVPSGGVTLKRRCTSDLQSSLIVNKLLSLSLSLPPSDYVALKYWCWRTGEEPLHAEYGQVQRGVSSVYHQLSHSSPGSWCLLQPVA